jgi:hypothetical protein
VANDVDIKVGVIGRKNVLDLSNAIDTLGKNSEKLARKFEQGRLENSTFVKALSQQVSALKRLGISTSDATKFVYGNAEATKASIAADKEAKSAKEALLQTQKKMESAWSLAIQKEKALTDEANRQADADRKLAAEKDRLSKVFVPLYAQSKLYEVELQKLNRAQALGIISDKQRAVSLAQLDAAFANGTGVFSNYTQQVKNGANRAGVAMQQFGYQAGDFIVQVQSGTNAFVAFGQQATQIVGFLPMMVPAVNAAGTAFTFLGMSIGAITLGLSIIIPLATAFGAYWMRTSEGTDKAKKSLSELEERIKSIDSTLKDWVNTKKAASAGMTVEEMFGFQSLDAAKKKVDDLKVEIQTVNDSTAGGRTKSQKRNKLLEELKVAEEGYAEALDRVNKLEAKQSEERRSNFWDQKGSMQEELSMMRAIATFGKDSAQVRNLEAQQRISNANAEIDRQVAALNLTEAQGKALKELNLKVEAERANEIKNSVGQAYLDAIGLGNTKVETGINKAAEAARILAERMGISLAAATAMVNLSNPLRDYNKKGELNKNMSGRGLPVGFGSGIVGGMTSSPRPSQRPMDLGVPDTKKGSGGIAGKIDTQEEYLAKLVREYTMKKKSIGMTDQQIKRNEFIFTLDEKIATMKSKVSETEIEALRKQSIAAYDLYQAAEKQAAIMDRVTGSIETMFMSFVDGTKSVGDAFKGMLRDIIMQIYQEKVAKQAASGIGNFLSGLVGGATGGINIGGSGSLFGGASWSANGDIVAGSGIQAFANGGVVGSPTMFQHGGGLGVMGEAGPEAIMPLKRGANGKLGVQMEGSPSQGNVVVNQTFNFSANGDDSVKKIIAQAAPQIAQMTQQQIMDSRRRGGSMKAAFG